jgi:hypothetical protein
VTGDPRLGTAQARGVPDGDHRDRRRLDVQPRSAPAPSRLWHAVPACPTMNEVWLRLLEAYRSS